MYGIEDKHISTDNLPEIHNSIPILCALSAHFNYFCGGRVVNGEISVYSPLKIE